MTIATDPAPTTPAGVEAARRVLMDTSVPWDDLRQHRVLGDIEARIDAASGPRPGARTAVWGAAGLAAIAAAIVFVVMWLGAVPDARGPSLAVVEPVDAAAHEPTIPNLGAVSTMALADGSTAQLHGGARVDVRVQDAQRVQLDQLSGTVRYEVTRNPDRTFVIDAAGVEIRVIGTMFTVRYRGDAHIEVAVERGLVEVAGPGRTARLRAGDSLAFAIEVSDLLIIDDDDLDAAVDNGAADTGPRIPAGRGPSSRPPEGPGVQALLAESDAARGAGDLGRAAAALSQLTRRFPRDPQAAAASFQLGNVQRRRGKHTAAARAFARCHRGAPRGPLAEDARAESAAAWADASDTKRATTAARTYLQQYPQGAHAARMRRILDTTE